MTWLTQPLNLVRFVVVRMMPFDTPTIVSAPGTLQWRVRVPSLRNRMRVRTPCMSLPPFTCDSRAQRHTLRIVCALPVVCTNALDILSAMPRGISSRACLTFPETAVLHVRMLVKFIQRLLDAASETPLHAANSAENPAISNGSTQLNGMSSSVTSGIGTSRAVRRFPSRSVRAGRRLCA